MVSRYSREGSLGRRGGSEEVVQSPKRRPCFHCGGSHCPRGVYLVRDEGVFFRVPVSLGSPSVFRGFGDVILGILWVPEMLLARVTSIRGTRYLWGGTTGRSLFLGGPGVSGGALGGSQWIPGAMGIPSLPRSLGMLSGCLSGFPGLWGNPVPSPFPGATTTL